MRQQTQHNRVTFLLDEEFFEELHRQLIQVRDAPGPDAHNYVLIAMWLCKLRTALPAVSVHGVNHAASRLDTILAQIAAAGRQVKFVLWNGSNPVVEPLRSLLWLGVKIATLNYVNEPLGAGFLRFGGGAKVFADEVRMWCNNRANAEMYMESYRTGYLTFGTSNHQKFIVTSVQNRLSALVGGFNLNEKYSAQPDHAAANQAWHDTAVLLEGPAAFVIQEEWRRRWNKQHWFTGDAPLPATAPAQVRPTNIRGRDYFSRKVTIATTNGEASPAEKHIRTLAIERIQAAQDYIYFENYAFTDPALITALAQKMVQAPNVKVMVVIHHPASPLYSTDTLWSYLQYYTFIKLALTRCTQIDAVTNAGAQVILPAHNPQIVESKMGWKLRWLNGVQRECPVTNITAIACPNFMYAPRTTRLGPLPQQLPQWPYPHSKLSLFDDSFAMVGSSNWTYRSMEYDGEITAMIEAPGPATAIRTKLFEHWEAGLTVDNFSARSTQNAVNFAANNIAANHCFMVPLSYGDFVKPDQATLVTKGTMDTMWTWF